MQGMTEPVLAFENLAVSFGRREVLTDLAGGFSSRCLGLLGPNGAGKTTLLHTLLGFHRPSRGTARVFGLDVWNQAPQIRSQVGYMPENDTFIAGMTAVRFVRFMAELSGLPSAAALERAHDALFYVGLGEARYRELSTYSLGMKQMVKLAQAVVHGPRLLVLDEPTNALDPPARRRMLRLIREIRDSGDAYLIVSSHLLRDVDECCDEVLILKEGRIAAHCNLEEERRSNRRFLELETRGDEKSFLEQLEVLGCEWALAGRRRLKVVMPHGVEIRDLYRVADTRKVQIRRLNYKRDSLEEIFLKAMEEEGGRIQA